MSKGVKKKGFTLVELVVVLAIFGLLASITGLGLYSWTRYSINKENNENARTIFLAAQESLTHMQASGTLKDFGEFVVSKGDDEDFGAIQKTPLAIASAANRSDGLYTIFYEPGTLDRYQSEVNTLIKETILPYLEGTGVFSHPFVLEINPVDGVVYSAFYSSKADYLYYEDAIYDNDGKKAASVDAGRGVKDIIYENGNYWIVTNSGWYYVLNDSFEQTLEPVKFEETESYLLTGYGLLIAKNKDYSLDTVTYDDFMESYMNSFMPDETEEETNDERFALYDATGEVVLEVPGSVSIYNNQSDDLDHFIFGDAWVGWVNLKTRESMILDLPDEEVKTLGEE